MSRRIGSVCIGEGSLLPHVCILLVADGKFPPYSCTQMHLLGSFAACLTGQTAGRHKPRPMARKAARGGMWAAPVGAILELYCLRSRSDAPVHGPVVARSPVAGASTLSFVSLPCDLTLRTDWCAACFVLVCAAFYYAAAPHPVVNLPHALAI